MFTSTKINNLISRLLASFIPILAATAPASAVPAKPGVMNFDNGGKTISVYLRGDERSHFYTTTDGHMLLRGDDGLFRYAVPQGGLLVPSAMTASQPGSRSVDEEALLASFSRDAAFSLFDAKAAERAKSRRAPSRVAEEASLTTFPTKGSPRCLAILVEFQDVQFTLPDPQQLFSDMLNQEGFSQYGATGSVRDFFEASSGGQFTPQFDVYGPVRLPYNMSYYGSNSPDTGDDERPYEMIPHAVDLLRDQVDFSVYDNDDDGIVDNIYVFYAGYGEADGGPANSIWPHSWNIHDDLGMEIYMNGKLINHYATNNELANGQGSNLAGIGVFCHEFSHVMGLPDLYSTLYTGVFTPGEFSLMDHGSYNNDSHTPPCHTGYERYCLGWVEPKVLSDPDNITMYPIAQPGAYDHVYMIKTPKKSEYYILENRQQRGWDEYIPGHGLLVWHIDFDPERWILNIVNIEKQYVDIVEADDMQTTYSMGGDPFPGTSDVTEFGDDTKPSMRTWDGYALYSPLTDIKDIDGAVSFAFKGGRNIFDEITAHEAADIKAGGFTAKWNEIARTTSYLLSVYTKDADGTLRYVEGYRKLDVGATGQHEVSGLTPATTYYYTVTGTNGRFYSSDSNEVEVTTLDPTLDYKSVHALAATDVTDTSFRANWEPLDDADSYELTLYRLQLGEPFETGTGFDSREIPSGWQTDASFDGRASYAVEVPSLRFTADGSYLSTRTFAEGIRTLSFWYRAASGSDGASIRVLAQTDGGWKEIHTVSPLVTAQGGETVKIDEIPVGTTAVRLEFSRPAGGSVSVDDVTIGYGGNIDYFPMAGRDAINAGNAASLTIDGLEAKSDYGYTVTAVNSEFRSIPSSMIGVTTATSGVDLSVTDNKTVTTDGLILTVTWPGEGEITVTDTQGRVVARTTGDRLRAEMPAPGVYIVSRNGKSIKTII